MFSSFLTSIDLASYTTPSRGLDPKALSFIGNVFAKLDQASIDDAFLYLQQTIGLFTTYLDVSSLSLIDDIVSLLDSGAAKVFVNRQQLDQLVSANIDQDRIVLILPGNTKQEVIEAISGTSVDVYSHQVRDVELVEAWLKEYGTDRPEVFVSFASPDIKSVLRLSKLSAIPIIPAELLTINPKADPELISVSRLLLSNATSDRFDGLFTTLVTDERGVALGLVYSSEESVAESLRTGRGVYQSRKRGLWYKGESSGDIQELVGIALDCDHDCLRYVVKQKGRGQYMFI
jgi:phosphoribosyl-ATP pyrophosphohydrolase/phosphoribosyl-AMP cyclohydrolase/histidinol dehydrogenase